MTTPIPPPSPISKVYSTVGRQRLLTSQQLQHIIDWQRRRKSAVQMARELGVHVTTLLHSVRRPDPIKSPHLRGQKRALTGKRLARALEWYCTHRTGPQRAAELGISYEHFQRAASHYRKYKGAPPDLRAAAVQTRRQLLDRLGLTDPV